MVEINGDGGPFNGVSRALSMVPWAHSKVIRAPLMVSKALSMVPWAPSKVTSRVKIVEVVLAPMVTI